MTEYNFKVYGKPQPKQRPRFSRGRTYTPTPTLKYEDLIRQTFYEVFGEDAPKLTGAIEMDIEFYFPIPVSTSKKGKTSMILGYLRPTKRNGDIDNLFKVVADALNGVAYWDDSQIIQGTVSKWYSETSRAEIFIKEV